MTLSITYPELRQIISDKLSQNVELQSVGNHVLKLTIHTTIKKIVTMNVDISAELEFSIFDNDLYADYKVVPVDGLKSKLLSGIINSAAPNVVNIVLNHFGNRYPQYDGIVDKVPDIDRLRINLAAIPQLQNILQHIKVESIVSKEEGLLITAKIK